MRERNELIRRRHHEWRGHHRRWEWLLDSLEGGERYRHAVYGYDRRGMPVRNLIRHKREYPDPRELPASSEGLAPFDAGVGLAPDESATDDDYELRRARTPTPTFVAEVIDSHLSRVYAREVKRDGPDRLRAFWADVDGCGTTVVDWMSETVAPLLLTLGQVDICLDHPPIPDGESVETRADVERLGLDKGIAAVILPQDMLWWRLDATSRRYVECLVHEPFESDSGYESRYRHWTETESTLYDADGVRLSVTPHPFGRVPIVRLFDRRKPRCRNVGQSRYEGIAERQREYYNRDSELILSDTTQAHPLLQGPEDYVQADGTVPIGPSWLLPKKKNAQGGSVSYEGFDIVEFPKEGAESIRKNKADLRDDVDRDSALVRPLGREGATQSGFAKMLDHMEGNNRLAKIARRLARAERAIAELALTVLGDGAPIADELDLVVVVYPTDFDLFTASDVASATADFQALVARGGSLPHTEGLLLSRLIRLCMPGLSDASYALCDAEITAYLADQARRKREEGTRPPFYEDLRTW